MPVIFYVSYVAMWVLLLVIGILVLLLYRHFGLMALGTVDGIRRDGLPVGTRVPSISGITAQGEVKEWIPSTTHPSLLAFVSPDCGPCAAILPFINQLVLSHRELDIVLLASGSQRSASQLVEKFLLSDTILCLTDNGTGIADSYRVRVTPFAFIIGTDGRVLAKGLCDNKVRLEQLLQAAGQEASFLEVTAAHS
jgi:methylamine dehydrogenase accessory protein MauD